MSPATIGPLTAGVYDHLDEDEREPVLRNTPRDVKAWPWPELGHFPKARDWVVIQLPDQTSTDADTWEWDVLVARLSLTFADVLDPRWRYFFPTGYVWKARGRVKRYQPAQLRRAVMKVYGERLRLARTLFGVTWQPKTAELLLPRPVKEGIRLVLGNAPGGRGPGIIYPGGRSRTPTPWLAKLMAEAAHYVYVNGPPGLAAMEAVTELEGGAGLASLLATWWRDR